MTTAPFYKRRTTIQNRFPHIPNLVSALAPLKLCHPQIATPQNSMDSSDASAAAEESDDDYTVNCDNNNVNHLNVNPRMFANITYAHAHLNSRRLQRASTHDLACVLQVVYKLFTGFLLVPHRLGNASRANCKRAIRTTCTDVRTTYTDVRTTCGFF